jgi:hypothetical protein
MARRLATSNVASAEPLSPTSTWSWLGFSALKRRTIWSACGLPEIRSVPLVTVAPTTGAAVAMGPAIDAAMAAAATAIGTVFRFILFS